MAEFKEGQDVDQEQGGVLSVENLFGGSSESYEQAAQRAIEEASTGFKVDYFRPDKLGVYPLRIVPIAPEKDGTVKRAGYEWPAHTLLMKINNPDPAKKPIYVSVVRATEAGFEADVIDTYRKLAVSEAKALGDDELAEKIGGGNFGGGLRFDYQHFCYILDMDERSKGFQLWAMSHGQFKDLDDSKLKLWKKISEKNKDAKCPISHFKDAYIVELEKKKDGKKTVYKFDIDQIGDKDSLTTQELTKLLAAPRIDEVVFRYNRRHHEAVQVFLKQCDEVYGLKVFDKPEVQEVVAKISAAIPASDTSSFTFEGKDAGNPVTIDSLYDAYDELVNQGLKDNTEEGQELRGKIREFMSDKNLEDVIEITRKTTNIQILDALAEHLDSNSSDKYAEETKHPLEEQEEADKAIEEASKSKGEERDSEAEDQEAGDESKESDTPPTRERRERSARPSRGAR